MLTDKELEARMKVRIPLIELAELTDNDMIYIPYCGEGDLYGECEQWWPQERVFAVDRDAGACERFSEKWPEATVVCADAETSVEFPADKQFAVADFDSYSSPHEAVRRFLDNARVARTFGVALTDGSPRNVTVQRRLWDFRRGALARFDREGASQQIGAWGELRRGWLAHLVRGQAELVMSGWNDDKTLFHGSFVVSFDPAEQEEAKEAALPPAANAEAIQQLLNAHWEFAMEDQDTARFCLSLLKERMKLEAQGATMADVPKQTEEEETTGDWAADFLGDD